MNPKRWKGSARFSPQHQCVHKQKCQCQSWKTFTPKEYTKTLLVNVLLQFLIIHVQGDNQWICPVIPVLCFLSSCLPHPQPLHSLSYRLARGQPSSRKGIPSTVRAAVFVLPNSIPFHSLSAHSVYFGALFTPRALTELENENISLTSNPMTWPLEATSSSSAKKKERR